jgi:hypothetical protein
MDGNYTFYFLSDDYGDLYLSSDDNSTNAKLICTALYWKYSYYLDPQNQISAPQYLRAGKRYYIRGRFEEAGGGDYMSVAVRISNHNQTKSQYEVAYHSVRERQVVIIGANATREVQRLTVSGVTGGRFRIVCSKGTTIALDVISSTKSDVASAIKTVADCGTISVVRTVTNGTTFTYDVTFDCPVNTSTQMMQVINFDLVQANASTMQLSSQRTVVPSHAMTGTFTLSFANLGPNNETRTTSPIWNTADVGTITKALQAITELGEVRVEVTGNRYDVINLLFEFVTFQVSCLRHILQPALWLILLLLGCFTRMHCVRDHSFSSVLSRVVSIASLCTCGLVAGRRFRVHHEYERIDWRQHHGHVHGAATRQHQRLFLQSDSARVL